MFFLHDSLPKYLCSLALVLAIGGFAGGTYAEPLFAEKLANAAFERTQHSVVYNGAYRKISYPNGDVPAHFGVCTDVLIRSYRALGVDLQKLVHEDMRSAFSAYPSKKIWGLTRTDANIDHRRVPNLETFFARNGQRLALSENPKDYLPGDIVSWRLGSNLPHIGLVSNKKNASGERYLIIHNVGLGPKMEDVLFDYKMVGHYRYHL